MNIAELIKHPDKLNKETLYDLRSLIAKYPYYQTARLLMLQNLYLLHDSTFDEELRRAAVYITDRRVIFNLVEASHYRLKRQQTKVVEGNRTVSLIDNFLSSMPVDADSDGNAGAGENTPRQRRQPTAADATVDYVAYLLSADVEDEQQDNEMKGQSLIDDFINRDGGRIVLQDAPAQPIVQEIVTEEEKSPEEEYFTETLAQIYIKQGRYLKALEIIKRLNLNIPKKNAYFADQIRFLEKLIANSEQEKRNGKRS